MVGGGLRISVVVVAAAGVLAASGSTTSAAAGSEAAPPLVGTWRTSPISQSDAEAALRRHGLAKWIKPFRRQTFFTAPITLTLGIRGGEWDLYGKANGKPREEIDFNAEYVVKGKTVDKIHSTGFTTLGWSVRGKVLTLRWLRTTEPPYVGIPDRVFQTALYMSRKFTRQT